MNLAVVTTYNQKLFESYAHKFIETYKGKWPFDLHVYSEDDMPWPTEPINTVKNLYKEVKGCQDFVERNKDKPKPKGFLHDATRFCYKVYGYTDFILNRADKYDGVICIDADSVFYKKIDYTWMQEKVHRDDCMMTYLGRGNTYSECGFLYFNMKHPDVKNYAKAMKHMYDSDELYKLVEWHDSYIWDHVRKQFEHHHKTKNHNIGDNYKMHVQARSCLGEIYDHCKGNRKQYGVSAEFVRRDEYKRRFK